MKQMPELIVIQTERNSQSINRIGLPPVNVTKGADRSFIVSVLALGLSALSFYFSAIFIHRSLSAIITPNPPTTADILQYQGPLFYTLVFTNSGNHSDGPFDLS